MRCDDGRVVSNVVCQALSGDDITIYGDGSQTRSFCYVDDMIEGLSRLMDSDRAVGMPVNLGNPNELTVQELVDLVLAMTGTQSRVVIEPLPMDDPRRRKPDIGRAIELLGWRAGGRSGEGARSDRSSGSRTRRTGSPRRCTSTLRWSRPPPNNSDRRTSMRAAVLTGAGKFDDRAMCRCRSPDPGRCGCGSKAAACARPT